MSDSANVMFHVHNTSALDESQLEGISGVTFGIGDYPLKLNLFMESIEEAERVIAAFRRAIDAAKAQQAPKQETAVTL